MRSMSRENYLPADFYYKSAVIEYLIEKYK